jgi:hypothetical protein
MSERRHLENCLKKSARGAYILSMLAEAKAQNEKFLRQAEAQQAEAEQWLRENH